MLTTYSEHITASAPGKVILFGEYAVLYGYPAIVTAVDCRVSVTIQPAPSLGIVYHEGDTRSAIFVPGTYVAGETVQFADAKLMFVARALSKIMQHTCITLKGRSFQRCRLAIDTRSFFKGQEKIGLGSSAALVVALTAAVWAYLGDPKLKFPMRAHSPMARTCLEAHAYAQQIAGSGLDVMTSLFGGTHFCQGKDLTAAGAVVPFQLPDRPCFSIIWTGKPAPTAVILRHMRKAFADYPKKEFTALSALFASSTQAAKGPGGWWSAVQQAYGGMRILGSSIGFPLISPEHAYAAEVVQQLGGVYKPSGAGGGDIGLAFFNNEAQSRIGQKRMSYHGLCVLPLAPHVEGLRLD